MKDRQAANFHPEARATMPNRIIGTLINVTDSAAKRVNRLGDTSSGESVLTYSP